MNWLDLCIFLKLAGWQKVDKPAWVTDDTRFRVSPPVYLKQINDRSYICFKMDVQMRKQVTL